MVDEKAALLARIGEARKRNVSVFADVARAFPVRAQQLGFVARDPEATDVTLEILRAMVTELPPARAATILQGIIENDQRVTRYAEQLMEVLWRDAS